MFLCSVQFGDTEKNTAPASPLAPAYFLFLVANQDEGRGNNSQNFLSWCEDLDLVINVLPACLDTMPYCWSEFASRGNDQLWLTWYLHFLD